MRNDGKESLNLQTIRRLRSSGATSLNDVKTGADKSAENTASQPTRQSVFPQPKAPSQNKPTVQTEYKSISSPSNTSTRTRTDEIPHSNRLQQSLSPIDEKLAPPPTSFLKKEKALENNIEIAIKPTRVKKTKIRKEKGDGLGLPKFVLPTVFGIILVTLCIVAYIFVAVKPFYEASWTANITEEEKAKGVKELSYVITPEHFKEKLISEIEGLTVSATLSSKIRITKEDNRTFWFKKTERKIDEIQVNIPSILCQKSGSNCDEVKANFEKSFRDEIQKQDAANKDAEYKFTRLSTAQMKLESESEGTRILLKKL